MFQLSQQLFSLPLLGALVKPKVTGQPKSGVIRNFQLPEKYSARKELADPPFQG